MPNLEQKPLFEESLPTKPVQSVAPQVREAPASSVWGSGCDDLLELWDRPPSEPARLVDLTDEVAQGEAPASAAAAKPQSLLSFEEMMDGTLCSGPEEQPVGLADPMTLSYQHALQHAAGEEPEDGQLLMTNGETLLKEGTQVRRLLGCTGACAAAFRHPCLCCHRRARGILANHRRRSLASRKSLRPNLRQSFITSHQVRLLSLFVPFFFFI